MSTDLPPPDETATELDAAVRSSGGAVTGNLAIEVVEGPNRGARVELPAGAQRALVGQSPVCALRLDDRRASRRHAAFEPAGDAVRVTDLGSTNGTFVGEVRIVEALVPAGNGVRIGDTVLEVVRVGASAEAAASPPPPSDSFGRVIGASAAMRALYAACTRLAAANVPVLIEGETGTGKEALAEALHESGPRAGRPFVVFDCTAVAPSLVESELFGHERGAFTGAVSSRPGVFEQADGGTLLIDEIGDLDATLQPKLLRALERAEVRRVGGQRVVHFDVRILAATRRDLDREIQQGRFRDDLFHRLAVARVELPPLRKRKGDVALLARHFAARLGAAPGAIPYDQIVRWEDAAWPGNVRELRNAVARYLALGDVPLPREPRQPDAAAQSSSFEPYFGMPIGLARQRIVDAFERQYVERILALHGGDIAAAAAASGIARRQFFRLKAKLGGE